MKKCLILLTIILLLVGCDKIDNNDPNPNEQNSDYEALKDVPYYEYLNSSNPTVEFIFSNDSKIKFELFKDIAPNTVKNFLLLASTNHYDGTLVYAKDEDFVHLKNDKSIPNSYIESTRTENGHENPVPFSRGTIYLFPYSGNTNFDQVNELMISFVNDHEANGNFSIFGGVVEGLDTLTVLEQLETDGVGLITESVEITSINIDAKGFDYSELIFKDPQSFRDDDNPRVIITFEDSGTTNDPKPNTMKLELFPEVAPATVDNFLTLVEEEFYDGLSIYKVMGNSIAQGGANNTPENSETIFGEFYNNNFDNDLDHVKGVISMRRNPNEIGSIKDQFLICNDDTPILNRKNAAFGYMISGYAVLDEIMASSTDENGILYSPIIIEKIELLP